MIRRPLGFPRLNQGAPPPVTEAPRLEGADALASTAAPASTAATPAAAPAAPARLRPEMHRIPGHSSWFRINGVAELERMHNPDFFTNIPVGQSKIRGQVAYVAIRNAIVTRFREDPTRHLTLTEARKGIAFDFSLIKRVFDFLERWVRLFRALSIPVFKVLLPLSIPTWLRASCAVRSRSVCGVVPVDKLQRASSGRDDSLPFSSISFLSLAVGLSDALLTSRPRFLCRGRESSTTARATPTPPSTSPSSSCRTDPRGVSAWVHWVSRGPRTGCSPFRRCKGACRPSSSRRWPPPSRATPRLSTSATTAVWTSPAARATTARSCRTTICASSTSRTGRSLAAPRQRTSCGWSPLTRWTCPGNGRITRRCCFLRVRGAFGMRTRVSGLLGRTQDWLLAPAARRVGLARA